jgi:broad specificity phosphatase PhoE
MLSMKKNTIPLVPFYFIRHGKTEWNHKNMIQGHIDISLNEQGVEQARMAASLLANQGITQIVASPLLRAHKTAELINEMLQVPLHVHEGLKERFLGTLEGTIKTEAALTCIATNYTQMAEGAEDVEVFKKRISDTLYEILDPDHTTLIVAHGGVYWALMHILGHGHQKSKNTIPYFFDPNGSDLADQQSGNLLFSVKEITNSN